METYLRRNEYDEKYTKEGYPHPYQYELEHFELNPKQLEPSTEQIYPEFEKTPSHWISNLEDLHLMLDKLEREEEIAIDLEVIQKSCPYLKFLKPPFFFLIRIIRTGRTKGLSV